MTGRIQLIPFLLYIRQIIPVFGELQDTLTVELLTLILTCLLIDQFKLLLLQTRQGQYVSVLIHDIALSNDLIPVSFADTVL